MDLTKAAGSTISTGSEVYSGNVFIDGLSLDDRVALLKAATPETLVDGQILTNQGECVSALWFPLSARLLEYHLGDDGRRLRLATVSSSGASTIPPVLENARSRHQIVCVRAGDALKLSAVNCANTISTRPSLLLAFLQLVDAQLAEARDLALSNALHTVDQRVARWILRTGQLFDSKELHTTQEDVALDLGVQRSTVVASFRSLKSDGIIRHTRGSLRIKNLERLMAIAESSVDPIRTDTSLSS